MSTQKKHEMWSDKVNVTFKEFKIDRNEKAYRSGYRYRVGIIRKDGQRVANTQIGIYTRIKTAQGIAELLNKELIQNGNSVEWEFLPNPESDELDGEPSDEQDIEDEPLEEFSEILFDSIGSDEKWYSSELDTVWTISDIESSLLQRNLFFNEDED